MADMTNMEPAGRVIAVFRGEYNDAETYEYYDEVLYKNSSYIAKRTTSGNPPPTGTVSDDNWRLVAKGIMDADISESEIVFEEAAERSNIESGEKSKTIMGKIRKIFSDLKSVAFSGKYADLEGIPDLKKVATSGSYDDLENKPSIPAAAQNGALTIQRNGTDVQSFSADQSIDVVVNIEVPEISRSTAITAAGEYALDAIEKNASIEGTLAYQIAQQNSNFGGMAFGIDADGNYGYIKAGADTVIPFSTSDLKDRCMFSSVNCASNMWESVWLDRGDVFCAVSSMEIELSKMSIYITRGPVVNCWIRALVTGIYRLGYTSIGTTTSYTMQLTERQFVAGEYIIKDTYNYNTVTGNRACYCEFIR